MILSLLFTQQQYSPNRYMPRDGIIPLTELWPGSELRTLRTGHVTAYLFNHQVFR